MRQIMARLKLTVNEEKTHVCRVPEEHFEVLGYTFGQCYSTKTGRAYPRTRPSKKSIRRMAAAICAQTERRWAGRDAKDVVEDLNRMLRGWVNYFSLGPVSKAYRILDVHTTYRLRKCRGNALRARRLKRARAACSINRSTAMPMTISRSMAGAAGASDGPSYLVSSNPK
jgi:RNA-directed DNA polymerase